jgi:mycothiol synthase
VSREEDSTPIQWNSYDTFVKLAYKEIKELFHNLTNRDNTFKSRWVFEVKTCSAVKRRGCRIMEIIPATADHYQGAAEVFNSIYPENHYTAQEIQDGDQRRDPRFKCQRWAAIDKDRIVGIGYYTQSQWFDHPQKFMVWVGVLPDYRMCGIGSMLFDSVMLGLEPFDPIALRATAADHFIQSRRFLEKREFQEVIRDIRSEIDVQSFDLSRYTGFEDRFRDMGIEIKTIPELRTDPNRNQKLYDLDWELSLSVPGDLAASIGRRGLNQYIEYAIQGPNVLPEGFFVAVKGDEYVGLSHVLTIEKGDTLYHGLTGVKHQYRGLGIGLAMKVRVIAFAQATGHKTIKTDNDSKNTSMLAMNERLGYQRKYDLITYEKQLRSLVTK